MHYLRVKCLWMEKSCFCYIGCSNCHTRSPHPQVLYTDGGQGGWVLCCSAWMLRTPLTWSGSCNLFFFYLFRSFWMTLSGTSSSCLWGFPDTSQTHFQKVPGLRDAFCSWRGRLLHVAAQLCCIAGKLHMLACCGSVNMTLLSGHCHELSDTKKGILSVSVLK